MHRERLVEALERVLAGTRLELLRRLLARRSPQMVDAEPPSELREPGLDRSVVAEPVEMLVRAREDLLEDVFGRMLGEAEALDGDRVDVARKPFDELAPSVLIPQLGNEATSSAAVALSLDM